MRELVKSFKDNSFQRQHNIEMEVERDKIAFFKMKLEEEIAQN